ncbi:hypothetical protein LRD69_21310 [Streptomyces sp. JH14]|uniref:hypothetical protein n=1 Tax=Streptomyces sp. JH14 TaxID=2793630 RepID=UPI0023F77A91|nr:hypothetical protein [Streptomyces sp. JH14]MDF6044636.1 hypothetical protein [Streptomyces sp. JH14]
MEHESGLYEIFPGVTAVALGRCRSFFRLPGRTLYPGLADRPCRGCSLDDVTHARDVPADILAALPPRLQTEPGRLIARIDAELLRRTLPDPRAPGCPWRREASWRMRLYDGVVDPPRRRRRQRVNPGSSAGGSPGRG